jgi:hypothetical protein
VRKPNLLNVPTEIQAIATLLIGEIMKTEYKVIKFIDQKTNEEFYALAEVVYEEDGTLAGCHEPILDADTLQDLIDEFERIKKAFVAQPIHEKDFFNVH